MYMYCTGTCTGTGMFTGTVSSDVGADCYKRIFHFCSTNFVTLFFYGECCEHRQQLECCITAKIGQYHPMPVDLVVVNRLPFNLDCQKCVNLFEFDFQFCQRCAASLRPAHLPTYLVHTAESIHHYYNCILVNSNKLSSLAMKLTFGSNFSTCNAIPSKRSQSFY